jgi:F-type H+-transporting ATPase subunit epsilon
VSAGTLLLDVVTPDGRAADEAGLDAVVLRRVDERFALGTEIAVFPLHAPMLVRLAIAPLRYRRGSLTRHLAVGGGFAEVKRDRVLVVTPRCEPIPADAPEPRASAAARCARWRLEATTVEGEPLAPR